MKLTPTFSPCRMTLFPGLKIILLALPLSACLKVTGEAKDSFDLENEAPKLSLSKLLSNNDATKDNVQLQPETALHETVEHPASAKLSAPADNHPDEALKALSSKATDTTSDASSELEERVFSTLSPQDVADFKLWKKARSEGSSEYRQFREYLEFKEYQKWLKLQDVPEPH